MRFLLLLILFAETVSAQRLLRIMSADNEEGILIQPGEHIGYELKKDTNFYTGAILQIKDSSIVVGQKEILLSEISVIALKGESKKNILWGVGILAAEAVLIGVNYATGGDKVLSQVVFYSFVPAVVTGVFLIIRGIIKLKKYEKYPIGQEWSITTVPPEKR